MTIIERPWGYGWLMVTNLSPLRATDPRELLPAVTKPFVFRKPPKRLVGDSVAV